jgi:hypothetical protein
LQAWPRRGGQKGGRPVLAAVSRSPGNAVIDDIPEPGTPLAGREVARPEAAGIRGSECITIPAILAHRRVPGIIAREFRAMSSSPSAPDQARPRHRHSRPAAGCENASTSPSPRARRSASAARAPDAPRSREPMPNAVRALRRAARAGEQAYDQ